MLSGLKTRLNKPGAKSKPTIESGVQAARGLVEFVITVYNRLPPQQIVDTYNEGHNEENRAQLLWDNYKNQTLEHGAVLHVSGVIMGKRMEGRKGRDKDQSEQYKGVRLRLGAATGVQAAVFLSIGGPKRDGRVLLLRPYPFAQTHPDRKDLSEN